MKKYTGAKMKMGMFPLEVRDGCDLLKEMLNRGTDINLLLAIGKELRWS